MNNSRITHYVLRITFFVIVLFATACASPSDQPPNIAYGRDVCEACGMIISEARFAAATIASDGKTFKFDDAGEMFIYHTRRAEIQVRAWFVHDYESQKWINGKDALYVIAKDVKSPMGTGVAAFAERAAADTFGKRFNVKTLTFDEAFTAFKEGKTGM